MSSLTRNSGFLRFVGSALAIFGGPAGVAAALALNVRANEVDRRNANRAARDAYNASLQDRLQTIRSAEAPRGICYGENVIGGVLTYAREYGSKKEFLVMVVSLFAGHEIEAIDEIWIGDRAVGALDVNGFPVGGPFSTTRNDLDGFKSVASTGSAAQAVTTDHSALIGTVFAIADFGPDNGQQPVQVVSVVGTTITINTSLIAVGTTIVINYRYPQTTTWQRIKKYLGSAAQTADADVIASSGGQWTVDHKGQGVAYLAMFASYNEDVFPSGIENVKCRVRGKKLYDPRTTLTVYSKNPALAARDYLTDPLGFGCSAAEIDDASFIAAANVCDEFVTELTWLGDNWGLTSRRRYECDTFISTAADRGQNRQILADSMAGYIVYSQGQWHAYAGAFSTPAITLTEHDLADTGAISIQSREPRRSLFNQVRGTFVDALNSFQPTDYPPVVNALYRTEDGGEALEADIALPAVTDVVRAQRLAKIFLERHRQALTLTATFKLSAYRVTPGDIIAVSMARYGWSAKPFRVLEREYAAVGGITLMMREEAAGVYAWTGSEATTEDLAPNTTLPNPFVTAAIGTLTLASGTVWLQRNADGTVSARIHVEWPALVDSNVTQGGAIEVELLRIAGLPKFGVYERVAELRGDALEALIANVEEGRYYIVRLRARNGLRVHSAWTYSAPHLVIGKTEPPTNVNGLTSETTGNGLLLKWNEATDIDYAATELRFGTVWNTALVITRKNSRTHLWGWQPAGALTVLAKHYDTSGNESLTAASTVVNVSAPGTPSLTATVIANNVLLSWTDAQTTQPIKLYRFKIGSTFAGAALFGTAGGDSRFETYFSTDVGTQKIWIQAEDVAGNVGTPTSVDVLFTSPLGFKQRIDFTSAFAGTKVNALPYEGGLLMAVNTTETWSQHFTVGHTWNTSQDKINAGFPIHATPSQASGSYEEVFDFGTALNAATTIAATLAQTVIADGGTLTVNLAVSNTSSTGPWTTGPTNAANWTTSGFRWVRVQIAWSGDGGSNDLVLVQNLKVRLSQQKKTETGLVACVSTDSGGTTFTFTETFASIDSIQATPVGTTDRRAVVDFTYSTANPTTCKVLLFDSAGARATGDVRLQIEGFA